MYNDDLVNDTYKVVESNRRQKSQTFLLNQENYSYILKNNKKFQSTYKTIHFYIKQISVLDSIFPNLNNSLKQQIYFISNQMIKYLQQIQNQSFIIKNIVYCVSCFILYLNGVILKKQQFLQSSSIKYRYFIKHKNQIIKFAQTHSYNINYTNHQNLLKKFCQIVQQNMNKNEFFKQQIADQLFIRINHSIDQLYKTKAITIFLENQTELKFISLFYIILIHKFYFKDLNNEILKEIKEINQNLSFVQLKNQIQYLKHLILTDFLSLTFQNLNKQSQLKENFEKIQNECQKVSKNQSQKLQLEFYLKQVKKINEYKEEHEIEP